MTNPVHTPALPAPAVGPMPEPAMNTLFGSFWPDTGVPGNVRAVLCSLGVGLLAAMVLPFRDHGLGTFAVLLAAGGVVLGFSVNRRSPSPWPVPRCARCWQRPSSSGTQTGSWFCASWPAVRSALPGS